MSIGFFFFSSRRRNTRLTCDWSSDVCSSDLDPDAADGFRALVDRLWPRGISKQRAALDDWLVDLAPSTALRKWFHRNPTRWLEFATRYRAELRAQAPALQLLRQRAAQQ